MTEVKNYAVRIHGGSQGSGNGIRASVHLFDKNRMMIGFIEFVEKGYELKSDAYKEEKVVMFLPISRLKDVVDMLRHESPVFMGWQPTLKNAFLGTSQEPVGEGE